MKDRWWKTQGEWWSDFAYSLVVVLSVLSVLLAIAVVLFAVFFELGGGASE